MSARSTGTCSKQHSRRTADRRIGQRQIRDGNLPIDLAAPHHPPNHPARRARQRAKEGGPLAHLAPAHRCTYGKDSRRKRYALHVEEPPKINLDAVQNTGPRAEPDREDADGSVEGEYSLALGEGAKVGADNVVYNDAGCRDCVSAIFWLREYVAASE